MKDNANKGILSSMQNQVVQQNKANFEQNKKLLVVVLTKHLLIVDVRPYAPQQLGSS